MTIKNMLVHINFPQGYFLLLVASSCFAAPNYPKEAPSSPADDYEVLFEDPSYGDGYSPPLSVAQRLTKLTIKSCLFLEFQIHN